ncbi:glycosyltransferase [Haloechinothrix sp. LS1_15]|uniref:glycosyltransferase n=1 Tax=Haloechinothrix sp. LS1_15 TaxID=2652248 RepID=UPI002948012C|nr:glycosyltransferase [Haloechinothrix sp. LS1_15]MDV6011092.1 glycosyltransferase family 4 protein [Haloechinothrix sp. LS1_15]
MRVLVVTVVHNPRDARIRYRQIPALLEAGHEVTYIAPFEHFDTPLPVEVTGLTGVSVPRAVGRRRLGALQAVRAAVAAHAPGADIVLMHDPELVLAVAGLRRLPPVVWDVHEDTAATMTLKPWLPRALRPVAVGAAKLIERFAERRYHLLLADTGYRELFRNDHPVVPNTTYVPEQVPPPGADRAIYVGHLTRARGTEEMVAVGRRLRGTVRVELVGDADAEMRPLVEQAHAEGAVVWYGFVPNDQALPMVEGALAGLSLRHDEANYRNSWATKAVEYMARGIPTVSTPTPPAPEIVERHQAGFIVPFGDPDGAADAVLRLRQDAQLREAMGKRAHQAALAEYAWPVHARDFVANLERWTR